MGLNWDIKKRVVFIAVVPGAAIALGLAFYFLLLRYEDVETALISRGAALARQLAPAAEYGAFSGNVVELQRIAQATVREADVAAVVVHDSTGHILAVAGDARLQGDPAKLPDGWSGRSSDGSRLFFHAKIVRGNLGFDDPFLMSTPQPLQLGSVTLELSRRNVAARKEEILAVTILFTAALLAAALMLAYRLGRDITEPVLALETVVGRIQRGQLQARVTPHRAGTLHMLEDGINAMAMELEAAMRRSEAALADSEAELREQHEFAQTLLKSQSDAGVGTLLIEDGRIVYANEMACRIYDYSESELRALPSFLELVHPSAREQEWDNYCQRLAGAASAGTRYALPVVTRNGVDRIVELAVAMLPGSRSRRQLSVVVDITDRKRDEALLASAYDELKVKKEEAERANLAKTRFLAAASHDLRQPLHALTLFAAQLHDLVPAAQRRLAGQINSAANAMGELLEALLDISRLDLAGLAARPKNLPLDPLLQRIADSHQATAMAAGLRLVARPTAAWVRSDPQMLERMLANLVGNALRYTPGGGTVLLTVRRAGDDGWRIEVRDNGIGIAEEHLPFVFQEFYQVANEERDAGKGLGLGLAIVDRLAQALGHRLTVRSRPGRGSTFAIQLPRVQPEVVPAPPAEAAWHQDFSARVAVISTHRPVGESLCALLLSWGCNVVEAQDPAEVGDLLERSSPDVLVCDDACYAPVARTLESYPGLVPPVILLGEEIEGGSPQSAVRGRLSKPLRPARLRALLRHLLEEKGIGEVTA